MIWLSLRWNIQSMGAIQVNLNFSAMINMVFRIFISLEIGFYINGVWNIIIVQLFELMLFRVFI